MATLTDHITYADAQRLCSPARLWELFDGDRQRMNIAHECIDRHPADRIAVRLVHSLEHGSGDEAFSFGQLAEWSARFAHYLADRGVGPGDRVGIMLEPSLPFYAGLFGAMKRGAPVPLFTLFGPDGLRCASTLHAAAVLVSPRQARHRARRARSDASSPTTPSSPPQHYPTATRRPQRPRSRGVPDTQALPASCRAVRPPNGAS